MKNKIGIILALCMIISMLSGCGGNEGVVDTSTENKVSEGTQTEQNSETQEQVNSETQKPTEVETQKPSESESQKPSEPDKTTYQLSAQTNVKKETEYPA